jgi:hypothetical protein
MANPMVDWLAFWFGGDVVGFLHGSVLVVTIVPLQALTVLKLVVSDSKLVAAMNYLVTCNKFCAEI